MTYLYPAIFGSSVALIMAISAAKLARSVKKLTNKKPNVCLINWHIFNLLLLTIISIITVIVMLKLENWQNEVSVAALAFISINLYVDLFLIFLLFKFIKPKRILDDGRDEASAILFAHDARVAEVILLNSFRDRLGTEHSNNFQEMIDEFLGFVIKEWTKDIKLESSISFEFID